MANSGWVDKCSGDVRAGRTRVEAAQGQSLIELALVMPIIMVILLGVIALGGAMGVKQALQASTSQGARIGALEGNGGYSCIPVNGVTPPTPVTNTVDMDIINAVTTTSGIDPHNIGQIQIYKANASGAPYSSGGTPQADTYTAAPFTSPSSLNWPACARSGGVRSDSIGVSVTYRYRPFLPLPNYSFVQISDQAVQRINPAKGDAPCPFPGIPISLTVTQAMSNDILSWTMPPGVAATGYNVYSSISGVNGDQFGDAPVYIGPYTTTALSDGSAQVQATLAVTTNAPSLYQVDGTNFCGEGERGDSMSNGRTIPTPTPTATATASATATPTATGTSTATAVPTATGTSTATAVPTTTATLMATGTTTAIATTTATPDATATATTTGTTTAPPSATPTITVTTMGTATATTTATGTTTTTATLIPPTSTNTPIVFPTATGTATATATTTGTATGTATPSTTATSTATPSTTATSTAAPTSTATVMVTATVISTLTTTPAPTTTPSSTP